jgi:hypothetical protein
MGYGQISDFSTISAHNVYEFNYDFVNNLGVVYIPTCTAFVSKGKVEIEYDAGQNYIDIPSDYVVWDNTKINVANTNQN